MGVKACLCILFGLFHVNFGAMVDSRVPKEAQLSAFSTRKFQESAESTRDIHFEFDFVERSGYSTAQQNCAGFRSNSSSNFNPPGDTQTYMKQAAGTVICTNYFPGRLYPSLHFFISQNRNCIRIVLVRHFSSIVLCRCLSWCIVAIELEQVIGEAKHSQNATAQDSDDTALTTFKSPVKITIPLFVTRVNSIWHQRSNMSQTKARWAIMVGSTNGTITVWKHGIGRRTNGSRIFWYVSDGKDYPFYPNWSQLYKASKIFARSLQSQSRDDNIMTYSRRKVCLVNILLCIAYLSVLCEYVRTKDITKVLRFFTKSFFLNWRHLSEQLQDANCKNFRQIGIHGNEKLSSQSYCKENSLLNTLNEHIFRPWQLKTSEQIECRTSSSKRTDHCCVISADCSKCLGLFSDFQRMGPQMIQVTPVTRFLPDATRNPDIDLAHVGYRLATLSALPPSVPVSRIRLAGSGFYFRGQGDEVTCYSCRARHSGWTADDNPMEIHRRLSPQCQHVLQMDRELSHSGAGGGHGEGGAETEAVQRDQLNRASMTVNSHVEVSETSHVSSQQPASTSHGTMPSLQTLTVSTNSAGTVAAGRSVSGAHQTVSNTQITEHGNTSEDRHQGNSSATSNVSGNIIESSSSTSTDARSGRGSSCRPTSNAYARRNAGASTLGATGGTDGRPPTSVTAEPVRMNNSSRPSPEGASNNSNSSAPRPLFPRAGLELGLAVYPMYQDMASRRRSFTTWDDRQAPPLDQIILSGMFYAGYADCVRCFYCGVGLKHWVVTDDVWTEHVRWRPGCDYLRTIKGDQFIRDTQRRLGIESGERSQEVPRDRNSSQATSQWQQPSSTTPSTAAVSAVSTSRRCETVTTTTTSVPQPSPASLSATSTSPSGVFTLAERSTSASQASPPSSSTTTTTATSVGGAAAALRSSGSTAAASQASAGGSDNNDRDVEGDGGQEGVGVRVVSSAAEDRERLARLQEENRRLSSRFRCRMCHQAAIDTILMPCGHLVVCDTCARSTESCPLCHDTIRATARVHMG